MGRKRVIESDNLSQLLWYYRFTVDREDIQDIPFRGTKYKIELLN